MTLQDTSTPTWLTTMLLDAIPALLSGILAAVITLGFSLRRFRSERWWERKADAYSQIVEALDSVTAYWTARVEENREGERLGAEERRRLYESSVQAQQILRKAAGVGAYIISDAVAGSLARLQNRPRFDPDDDPWVEICEGECNAHKAALTEIRKLAKKDLGI